MKIIDKLKLDKQGIIDNGPINIVMFGDSITHCMEDENGRDYDLVYWNLLRRKINKINDFVPVNVINSAIGGTTAKIGVDRMDRDVLSHNPDLLIVCFGLNDVNEPLDDYIKSVSKIIDKAKGNNIDTIFMTPNMLNTSVLPDTPKEHYDYAIRTCQMQNEGRMDLYMQEVIKLCASKGVKVCDCYKKWKELSKTQDITYLLANRINHPTKEMHNLFADSLFDVIFGDVVAIDDNSTTMYEEN